MKKSKQSEFGFGIKEMKKTTVCPACKALETTKRKTCSRCGEKLLTVTLFDMYKEKHKVCDCCGVVLSEQMEFCPHCGAWIKKNKIRVMS